MESTDTPYSDIEWIKFDAGGCFGSCPIFKMTIHEDGNAVYDAIMFNKLEGKFKTVIKKYNHQRLLLLIKKANISVIKSKYWVSFTDHPSYILKVRFKNGKTKRIVHPVSCTKITMLWKAMN